MPATNNKDIKYKGDADYTPTSDGLNNQQKETLLNRGNSQIM